MDVIGVVLAAGAGRRMGLPKALVHYRGVCLLDRAITVLRDGGIADVRVVLGAGAAQVTLPDGVVSLYNAEWATGMGSSLKVALQSAEGRSVLVHLVDLPGVGAEIVRAVLDRGRDDIVARACYHGEPGHPVLFGADTVDQVRPHGDRGARDWLRVHPPALIECAHLGHGHDLDTPAELR